MTLYKDILDSCMKNDPKGTREYMQENHAISMGVIKKSKRFEGYDIPSLTSTT